MWGGDACVAPEASSEEKRTGKTRREGVVRRGVSGVDGEWGRLRRPGWRGRRTWDRDEGDASVPTPRIIHPRPYGTTGFLPP